MIRTKAATSDAQDESQMAEPSYVRRGLIILLVCGVSYWLIAPKSYPPPPDDDWFRTQVVQSQRPVLVKFTAEWCIPCRMLEESLRRFEKEADGRIEVVRIDVDAQADLASHYKVTGIPLMLLFDKGKVIDEQVGAMEYGELRQWLGRYVP
ncbi:MAG: thioredoxin family protein [Pirellulaceae bacterium]